MLDYETERGLSQQLASFQYRTGTTLLDELRQVLPVEMLQHQKVRAAKLVPIQSTYNVHLLQLADRLRLPSEPLDQRRVTRQLLRQQFEGNQLVQLDVPRLPSRSHAPFAQLVDQLVTANPIARREFNRRRRLGGRHRSTWSG